jgi:hypothetical protein
MLIKLTKNEREFLEEQLLKLIEEESRLSHVRDEEIRAGIATFSEKFSVTRALVQRAIDKIHVTVKTRQKRAIKEIQEVHKILNTANENPREDEEEMKMDSVGPELLDDIVSTNIPF